MERIFLVGLAVFAVGSLAAKHVFVSEHLRFYDAERYCQIHYSDLSPLTNDLEEQVFRRSVRDDQSGWIGVYWENDIKKWMSVGGVVIENQDWTESPGMWDRVYWTSHAWISQGGWTPSKFFCLNLIVVQEEKTWEEALEHCRENHQDFTSLLSQTENILAKKNIQNSTITQRVWVGLRFLGDTWMWINEDPLEFQVWNQTADPDLKSPVWKRCGALTKQGEWENRDCEERLHFICV